MGANVRLGGILRSVKRASVYLDENLDDHRHRGAARVLPGGDAVTLLPCDA
jgi:hypothetical protein